MPVSTSITGCTGCCPSCAACVDGLTNQFTFPLSGFANGASCSDCGLLNGTVTLTYLSGTCFWFGPQSGPCPEFFGSAAVSWRLEATGGAVNLICNYAGHILATYVYVGAWDCKSSLTLPISGPTSFCAGWPATITITPV
jgi:hypothetical protein